jgi:hypothetical protein
MSVPSWAHRDHVNLIWGDESPNLLESGLDMVGSHLQMFGPSWTIMDYTNVDYTCILVDRLYIECLNCSKKYGILFAVTTCHKANFYFHLYISDLDDVIPITSAANFSDSAQAKKTRMRQLVVNDETNARV